MSNRGPDTSVGVEIPQSALVLTNDKKADILLSVHEAVRNAILFHTEHAYHATVWSVGLELAGAASWILYGNQIMGWSRYLLIFGLLLFGALTQVYLHATKQDHEGNGRVISRVEAALTLCDKDAYIKGHQFFPYTGLWLKPRSISTLQLLHGIVVAFVVVVVLVARPVARASQ